MSYFCCAELCALCCGLAKLTVDTWTSKTVFTLNYSKFIDILIQIKKQQIREKFKKRYIEIERQRLEKKAGRSRKEEGLLKREKTNI